MTFKTLVVKNYEKEMFDWSNKISDDEIAFVVGESDKVIYVWIGQNTSIVKKYKGGTLATKIKSQYQFYGFRTQTINQGEETGALKEEIAKLLGGQGSALSEKEKSSHVPIATQVSTPAPAPRPVEHVLIAQREVEAPPEKKITPAYQLNDLEAELENERKKASHRVAKMKEEMDAQKAELDAEIKRLSDELESAKNAINDVKKNAEMECKQLRGEKVALQGMVDSLKKDVDGMKDKPQSDAGIQKKMEELQRELDNFKEIQTKHDELLSLSEGLEKNNKELKGTISELQSEITILKSRLEAASKGAGSGEEIKKLKEDLEKEKIASIDARVESKKKLESTVAEYENKLKALEDKAASYKEQLERTQRDSMKRDDVKTAPVPKPPQPAETLDFVSIPEESSAADGSGLLFVNPYATGEIGAKIDPLQDLKSFLNNVDPSKPLDPELKKLLEIIAENMENDDDVLKDLRTIKKSVKDKKVEELIEETIKKINQKKK